jgi:hypothetical protein
MPRSAFSQLSHESIGSMSDSEDLSQYSDEDSVFADVESASSSSLSDQTLLKLAFSGAVHTRKCVAKDWLRERASEFVEGADYPAGSDSNKANKGRSYTSMIRGFVKKMTIASKKSA